MRVLIISDTHGKSSCIQQIHDIVGDVDMLIHLGDVEGDEKLIHDLFDCEIHMVRGNCDYNAELPIYDEFNIGDKKAFITHGHRYSVNSGTAYLEELIDTEGYDFVMYGHTHRRDLTSYKGSYMHRMSCLRWRLRRRRRGKSFLRICGDRADIKVV